MKILKCEMCGGTDIVKQDGAYVCQNCGVKYSVEEARKMMIEGTVEVKGTVSIDSSNNLKNLYQAARNARSAGDYVSAIRNYESINALDPSSWEAVFYLVILRTYSIKNGEIENAAIRIINCVPEVLRLIVNNVDDEQESKAAVKEVIEECYSRTVGLISASENFCDMLNSGKGFSTIAGVAIGGLAGGLSVASDLLSGGNNIAEHQDRCKRIMTIMSSCGENMQVILDMQDNDYKQYVAWVWEKYRSIGKNVLSEEEKERIQKTIDKYAPPTKKEFNRRITDKLDGLYTKLGKEKRGRIVSGIILIAILAVLLKLITIFADGGGFVIVALILCTSPVWIYAIGSIIKSNKAIEQLNDEISTLESQKKQEDGINTKELSEKDETVRKDSTLAETKAKEENGMLDLQCKAESKSYEELHITKRNKIVVGIIASVVCVIIVFIIVLNEVIIPNVKYNKAITMMDGKYNNAAALMEEGNIIEAYDTFMELDGYKDSADKAVSMYEQYKVAKLKSAKVGDYVFFGAYEQDNKADNGKEDIEWLVLEVKDGKALLISKYALDCKQYNSSHTDITWEKCSLRKWLNDDFINSAFAYDEKKKIVTGTVPADENPGNVTDPGNATQDQVFLLSIVEANKYFNYNNSRKCKPTAYAIANGAYVNETDGYCWWWLRSPGNFQERAAFVDCYGLVSEVGDDVGDTHDLYEYGLNIDHDNDCVRPALWIDLN